MYIMYKTLKSTVSFTGYENKVLFISAGNMKDALEIIKHEHEKDGEVINEYIEGCKLVINKPKYPIYARIRYDIKELNNIEVNKKNVLNAIKEYSIKLI